MAKATSRRRRTHNREATEQALLDACGKLLLESGPEGIGVNRVAAEAGVGKELIYRYFDGLPGLIKAWLERDANWPTMHELTTPARQDLHRQTLRNKYKPFAEIIFSRCENGRSLCASS